MREKDFYAKIANWDFSKIKYETVRKTNWDYYEKIKENFNENTLCLDLGTGGGEKVISRYLEIGTIIATDYLKEMIATANENLKKSNRNNIKFVRMDNLKIEFSDELFDIVTVRHTVINAKEIYRALKEGGIVIIEGVDKDDCIKLKDYFGYGQAYFDKKAISKIDYDNLKQAGFEILETVTLREDEYYKKKEDLLALLLKTPILQYFSEESGEYKEKKIDMEILDKYIKDNTTSKGIKLERVLYGIVAKKE